MKKGEGGMRKGRKERTERKEGGKGGEGGRMEGRKKVGVERERKKEVMSSDKKGDGQMRRKK